MNKTYITILAIVLIVIIAGLYFFNSKSEITSTEEVEGNAFDGRNTTFTLNGKQVTLTHGESRETISNSSAEVITKYFGNEASGDLNADGQEDRAFLVTQSSGGSGTFYYVVAALQSNGQYKTTNAFFVGDRIAPQPTEIHSQTGELRVNFADRKDDEPMTATPSQGKVLLLKVTPDGTLEGLMK